MKNTTTILCLFFCLQLQAQNDTPTTLLSALTSGSTFQVKKKNGTFTNVLTSQIGSGTVTSVGLSLPNIITVTNSPVISSGTLTGTLATQTANTVFAGPTSGGAATPAFRALVAADIQTLYGTGNTPSSNFLRFALFKTPYTFDDKALMGIDTANGGVGIGTNTPQTSSLLDLTSTTKGVLIPRMTTTQRNAISTPATGLQVYNTSLNKLNYYNGSSWLALVDSTALASGSAWVLGGQNTTANANIGSTDAFRFGITTNGTARLYFSSDGRMYNNTLTDIYLVATDSARFGGASSKWDLTSGFSRLYINSNIGLQFNNSTQVPAFNVGDNQSTAFSLNIQGGATLISASSSDGAESVTVGSGTAGSSATLQADTIAVIKGDRIRMVGNTGAAQPKIEVNEDADNGSNFIAVQSPASLSTDYTQTLTAATGEIPVVIKGSATLDFLSTAASTCSELTISVTGAADGDVVALGVPNSVTVTGAVYTAWVSAADTVTVQYCNTSTVGAGDPGSATFKVQVFK